MNDSSISLLENVMGNVPSVQVYYTLRAGQDRDENLGGELNSKVHRGLKVD